MYWHILSGNRSSAMAEQNGLCVWCFGWIEGFSFHFPSFFFFFFSFVVRLHKLCLTLSTVPYHYVNGYICHIHLLIYVFLCVSTEHTQSMAHVYRPCNGCRCIRIQSANYLFVSAAFICEPKYRRLVSANIENCQEIKKQKYTPKHHAYNVSYLLVCACSMCMQSNSIHFRFQFYSMDLAYAKGVALISLCYYWIYA